MGPANVSDRAAASGQAGKDRVVDLAVQEESAAVRCRVATAAVRDGRQARALWLSTFDGTTAARRLEGECETHLSVVHGGAVDRSYQAATKDRSPSARKHGHGGSSQPVLEHGLYERQVGRRTFVPHLDGGGPVHAGVRLSGSGPGDDRDDGGAGAGANQGGKRKVAGEHYRGQRNGILQSSLGSLGDESRRTVVFHSAGTTRGERIHRKLQRSATRRMFERGVVCFASGRTAEAGEVP